MDKILQQIGTFLGRKFSEIYTIFNDKYNELDNKKVDKEEGKELMPSPEGASDTVFLSETGWREVNTDKIRTHVISISIPFDSAWDFNGAQEITLEEGDYDRDEADSFIYDYFRYNNPNVVIRNTNTTAQSAQKGYHTVWKVALDTIAEGRALRLYLDIPKNLSFTMAPEADSAKFTRYCILLYLSQDEGNQTYILNNIGILPNGTDSFIPRKYLDGKLSDITSSYLPLSGGLMTGNIAFPDGKGLGSAVGQSDLLVRSGNTVKLGSAGFSARLYAENPVVREGLEGMFTMYDTSNLDIDKPFVTDLWAVYDAEGKNTQSIAVDLYNPVAKSATKVYRELLPVTDTNMGLMTPSYKTALDRLIPSSGESLSIYGTPASTWQLTLGTGPKLKNSGGIFELRDNSDNAYTDLILNNITIKGNVIQEGSSFITKAETVEVSDNILLLNRGEVGSGVTKGISGIQVDRGALADYQFIFDESDDRFKVGVEGDLWPVMLRNNESDLSDKFFLSWDASLKRAVTTNIVPETGLLFSGGVSNHPEYDITVAATGSGSIGFCALQANTPWSCTIGYNLNTRDVPSADILDFATSLNAYRYDKPSVLNMIYFDTYLSPNSIEPYGASSISLTTGSGDNLIHTKGGQNYIIYDSSNLDVEGLIQNYTLSGNIIGTPKATRIKSVSSSSFGDNLINKFPETIWGSNSGVSWVVPFRSGSADLGTAGAHAASLGWAIGDTHAYLSVAHEGNIMKAVIGGGDSGKITWYKELAFKDDLSDLSTVYYPYSGRGQMSIGADGRPILANSYGIFFKETGGGRMIEGIYMESHNRIVVGGPPAISVPVVIYSKLNVDSISTTSEQLGLLSYHPTDWTGVTNAQVGIGTVVDTMILRSGNANLMHYKNGTHYAILDTSNITELTIQFNGSTNTVYAPNAAKTVNITPAAIGAAAVGHTHVMSDISGLSLAWSSITGKPETATRWPSWSEVTNKPINPSYSFGGNKDSITTAQFLTHIQNLGAFSTGFGIYRGSWSYNANQSITDTGVGVIHLAGSTVEVIGNMASNCTIRVTVPTTSGNGTTKRIYVYCNNGDGYKPGWFAVARTDELTWNSISGKPSTFTPSSHTHTKSQITDFPSSMPASDVYAWAKASSKPSYSWSEITGKPSTFTPSSHTHPLSDISDLQASWDALLKAAPSAYVTRWPSWSEVTSKPSFATVATSGSYNDLSNKPSIPSAETAATIMSKINSQSEITFSKHVVCSAGAGTSSTSDIRFKNNITSLAPVLSHVLGSPGFFYTWKDEDEVLVGTSAQYWEGRITGLVREINDKSKTKTFSYERYTVILQEALKEEHMLREAEKEEYRKEICSLREELEDLKKLIQKLL